MNFKLFSYLLFVLFLLFPVSGKANDSASAETKGKYFDFLEKDIDKILLAKDWDIYVPVNTWHNREMYNKTKTDSYNEKPWGIGFGKHIYEDDILKGLYFMVFLDSHDKQEPIIGYMRQWNYYFDQNKDLSVGIGYTLGVTFRDDYNWLPIPVPLPIFGFQYKKFTLQTTYIPGPYNMFNVLFTWIRIDL